MENQTMSADAAPLTSAKRRVSQLDFARTLLLGRGRPRLRLGALLFGICWLALVWLLFPYALGIATWQGNVRYLGLGLLLIVAVLVVLAVRALSRVLWHFGLLWLTVLIVIALLAATLARGRGEGAASAEAWLAAGRGVLADTGQTIRRSGRDIGSLPARVVMAATNQPPPWYPKPTAVLEPVNLNASADEEPLVLPSESENSGITRGVLASVRTDKGAALVLHTAAGSDAPVVTKLDSGSLVLVIAGPQSDGERIWWKVSYEGTEGWCISDALVLISR